MPAQVFGPEAVVVSVGLALNGNVSGYTAFAADVAQVQATSGNTFANQRAQTVGAGQSDDAFAARVLSNLGLAPNAPLQVALRDYFAQVGLFERGTVILQLTEILSGLDIATGDLAVYASPAQAWNRLVAAGYAYASNPQNTLPSSRLGTNPGNTFTLTTNEDRLTGTAGDDTYIADAQEDKLTGKFLNALQEVDILDGGDGRDTLTVVLGQAGTFAPNVRGIETITLRYTGDATVLSLQTVQGLEQVNISGSDASKASQLSSIGALARFSLAQQAAGIGLSGAAGTSAVQNWTFDTAGSVGKQVTIDLGVNAASAARTLNITSTQSHVNIDSTVADTLTQASVNVNGTNSLSFTDSASTLQKVSVSGAGSVDFGAAALSALTTFDASASTGVVEARLGSTTSSAARAVVGGSGREILRIDGAATGSSIALGDGNDILVGFSEFSAYSKGLDGGAGVDILNVVGAVGLSAVSAGQIKGIEILDFGGWNSSAAIDLSLAGLSGAALQVDQTVSTASTSGTLNLVNAPDQLIFSYRSKAGQVQFAGIAAVAVQGKDTSGTTANGTAEGVTLNATLFDGDADNQADGNITLGSWTLPGYESLLINAALGAADGGLAALTGAAHQLNLGGLAGAQVETVRITGDVAVRAPHSVTLAALTRVDAGASTGGVTFNAVQSPLAIAFTGSSAADNYTAGSGGDTVQAGQGTDLVTLGVMTGKAGAKRDVVVLGRAADSQIKDSNLDGTVSVGADLVYDVIQQFDVLGDPAQSAATVDRIDVSAFGFTGTARAVFNASAVVTASTNLTLVSGAFGGAAVAFSVIASDTYVMVDANGDGQFSSAFDVLLKLAGVTGGIAAAHVLF